VKLCEKNLVYLKRGVVMHTAKVFWSGRSQAIRLPKDFRFDTETVHISRRGNTVILEPIAENWKWLDKICGKLEQDFIDAANEQPEQQKRPILDKLFR
jgi:antitoxin VapB